MYMCTYLNMYVMYKITEKKILGRSSECDFTRTLLSIKRGGDSDESGSNQPKKLRVIDEGYDSAEDFDAGGSASEEKEDDAGSI